MGRLSGEGAVRAALTHWETENWWSGRLPEAAFEALPAMEIPIEVRQLLIRRFEHEPNYVAELVFEGLAQDPEWSPVESAWEAMVEILTPRSRYWPLVPPERKRWLLLRGLDEPPTASIGAPHRVHVARLFEWYGEKDEQLAKQWSRSDKDLEKCRSARMAEIAVRELLRRRGGQVEDLAIQQVARQGDPRWKEADLEMTVAGRKHRIDVKNARWMRNRIWPYHHLKTFKGFDNPDNWWVAGVLSPWISKEDQDASLETGKPLPDGRVTWLGMLGQRYWDELQPLARRWNVELGLGGQARLLAPWLFDFGAGEYGRYDNRLGHWMGRLPEDLSLGEARQHLDCGPLGIWLAARRSMPNAWHHALSPIQREAYNALREVDEELRQRGRRMRLPHLYVVALGVGLRALQEGRGLDASKELWGLLSYNAVLDPLNTLPDLVSTLGRLGRLDAQLTDFDHMTIRADGIVKGRRRQDGKLLSLLAWCGSCGRSPLEFGTQENCLECGFLICPRKRCGACFEGCSRHQQRPQAQGRGSR